MCQRTPTSSKEKFQGSINFSVSTHRQRHEIRTCPYNIGWRHPACTCWVEGQATMWNRKQNQSLWTGKEEITEKSRNQGTQHNHQRNLGVRRQNFRIFSQWQRPCLQVQGQGTNILWGSWWYPPSMDDLLPGSWLPHHRRSWQVREHLHFKNPTNCWTRHWW